MRPQADSPGRTTARPQETAGELAQAELTLSLSIPEQAALALLRAAPACARKAAQKLLIHVQGWPDDAAQPICGAVEEAIDQSRSAPIKVDNRTRPGRPRRRIPDYLRAVE